MGYNVIVVISYFVILERIKERYCGLFTFILSVCVVEFLRIIIRNDIIEEGENFSREDENIEKMVKGNIVI